MEPKKILWCFYTSLKMKKISKHIIENFVFGNFPEAKYVSGSTDEIHFNTPFDNDNKKRLYVSTSTGKWFDQKAQRGSNGFEFFVSEYFDISRREAVDLLYREYSDDNDVFDEVNESSIIEKEKTVLETPSDVVMFDETDKLGIIGRQAKYYLDSRKISTSGLGYFSDLDSPYANRIFVPFYEDGDLVYFIARSFLEDEKMRYKNPSDLKAGDFVYNIDKIKSDVFIFEGAFDAMSLDFPQVGTCMLSSVLKEEQAKKILSKNPSRIVFVPDKDDKVMTKITILKNLIKSYNRIIDNKKYGQDISFMIYDIPEGYKDFNEYKKDSGNGLIYIEHCKPFNELEIQTEINMLSILRGEV